MSKVAQSDGSEVARVESEMHIAHAFAEVVVIVLGQVDHHGRRAPPEYARRAGEE